MLSAALAGNIWPHLSCHPGCHLGWTMWPLAADVTDFVDDGSAPGAGPGARLNCQSLPAAMLGTAVHLKGSAEQVDGNSVERAKQNGDMSVFVKCYTVCSKAASKWASCQLPVLWVTPSLMHWSAVDCKWVNLSRFLLPCGDAPDQSQGSACKALSDTPVLLIFPVCL